ncbi:hypothetical protein BpHYR1_006107 [Brachionus plicatilis]|uniref:Uncharacterized protein n=1 Tax=Brachionus plicatilis TaxID=10195 RepID=A0A3M7P3F9_BRAPC|nr:hypothetical protein BpHYR1_006107 [Brachionus plicatilis]
MISDISVLRKNRIECLAMVETKLCENKIMECDDNYCIYNKIPDGNFACLENKIFTSFECIFHKKHIFADNLNKSIYSIGISSCLPDDLYCHLFDSIVVWNKNSEI